MPFFTVGHSDRTIEAFHEALQTAGIESLVDVRKLPGSRSNPQFDEDVLAPSLKSADILYRHEPALGGLRGRSKTVPPEVNGLWRNRSFHNYADYAMGDEFADALARLRAEGSERATVVMCSEAVWWRCHRRIIADHLLALGEDVRHIMAEGRIDRATLTPGAFVHADGQVTYPPV
ncbi:DUF488 domain-containing protein [Humibacter ginsengisoli]